MGTRLDYQGREARDAYWFPLLIFGLLITASAPGRHVATLEAAKLIKVKKEFQGRKPRTWISLTQKGSTALDNELSALRDLIDRHSPRRVVQPKNESGTPTLEQ